MGGVTVLPAVAIDLLLIALSSDELGIVADGYKNEIGGWRCYWIQGRWLVTPIDRYHVAQWRSQGEQT